MPAADTCTAAGLSAVDVAQQRFVAVHCLATAVQPFWDQQAVLYGVDVYYLQSSVP